MFLTSFATVMRNRRGPELREKPIVRKKHSRLPAVPDEISKGWVAVGFDISLSSVAGAAFAWDAVTKRMKGPAFSMWRFSPEEDYFERLLLCVNSPNIVGELQAELNVILPVKDVVIAVEEPFPAHGEFVQRGNTQTLKQQAEMSGAFLAGLYKWGYTNIMQISNQGWRSVIAREISYETGEDVTTYTKKWKNPQLALRYNCKPDDSGKFRAQQWATDVFEPWIVQQGGTEIPNFPPMIRSKSMKVPRPEKSHAKAFQPDDRFDALAMAEYARVEAELTNAS
jgi:hypothetical protein